MFGSWPIGTCCDVDGGRSSDDGAAFGSDEHATTTTANSSGNARFNSTLIAVV